MKVWLLFVIMSAIFIVGGGIGYLIWLKTRPKKQSWQARIYVLGKGIKEVKNGIKISDLIPYAKDRLEKVDNVYRLCKLNLTTNAVSANLIEKWGPDEKYVDVLLEKDNATVLDRGYDKELGSKIFLPMPRERIELIKSEMLLKKNRLQDKKDILQAITPWIVTGICMLSLVAIAYFIGSSFVDLSENVTDAEKTMADNNKEAAQIYKSALDSLSKSVTESNKKVQYIPQNLGKQPPDE